MTTKEDSELGKCKEATICPLFELNGHSYTGYVKLTATNPGSVDDPNGKMNSCPDDMNLSKED